MDSFERREAKLRAQQKWAVVKKSVLPEKDEFLEKANKGKIEEWLEHWNKRRKTQTKLKGLMQHLRLAIRDFDVKNLFIRFTEGNKYPPKYPKSKKVPLWRPADKTSLTAILHMLDMNKVEYVDFIKEMLNLMAELLFSDFQDLKIVSKCNLFRIKFKFLP